MQTVKVRVLRSCGDITADYTITSDAPEMDAIGGIGTCHKEAVSSMLYRGFYGDARAELAERIETEKNVRRERTSTTKEDGTVVEKITEYEEPFVSRCLKTGVVTLAELNQWLQDVANDPEFAFTEYVKTPERKAKTKTLRIPKDVFALVQSWIAAGKADKAATLLGSKLNRTVEPTEQSLGLAVAEDLRRETEAARKRTLASVGLGE